MLVNLAQFFYLLDDMPSFLNITQFLMLNVIMKQQLFLGTIDCFLITTKLICNLMIFFSVLRCFTNNSIHIVTKQSFLRLESNYNNQYSSDLEHES